MSQVATDHVQIRADSLQLRGNYAAGDGGGVFIRLIQGFAGSAEALISLTNSNLSDNSCGGGGAALAIDGEGIAVAVSGTTFSGNGAAGAGGGAVYVAKGNLTATGSSFLDNAASVRCFLLRFLADILPLPSGESCRKLALTDAVCYVGCAGSRGRCLGDKLAGRVL